MTISAGTRLGPYEILTPLGAGGMGEVYRARDSRLARDVAIKVLPEEFFEDEERRARFEREARALAALNNSGIAAIHWAALPAGIPEKVKEILGKCLKREAKQRLHDIADARLDLEALNAAGASSASGQLPLGEETALPSPTAGRSAPAVSARGSRKSLYFSWVIAAAFAAAAGALAMRALAPQRDAGAGRVMRLQIVPRRGERLNFNLRAFAVSPDGTRLAYVVSKGATTELRLRSLDSGESAVIPGTEGAQHPFFSPDGKWIAFSGGPKLKKVAVSGGSPVALADTGNFRGGVWSEDGWIYYVPNVYVPVARIPSVGGTPENVTRIRAAEGEQQHRWPELLPGGRVLRVAPSRSRPWGRRRSTEAACQITFP